MAPWPPLATSLPADLQRSANLLDVLAQLRQVTVSNKHYLLTDRINTEVGFLCHCVRVYQIYECILFFWCENTIHYL